MERASNSPAGRARLDLRTQVRVLMLTVAASALFFLVSIYGNGLRDPRYLDGWILAGGMALQFAFHAAVKSRRLPAKASARWRSLHVFTGYVLIAAAVSHTDFTLPDTGFEWALWIGFALVTLSGIFGAYLSWAVKAKRGFDGLPDLTSIRARRGAIAQDARREAERAMTAMTAFGLPAPPYDAWIKDLYAKSLRDFFAGERNSMAHVVGSTRPVKRLTGEIDALARYVDQQGQDKLGKLRLLVVEKDRLDAAYVYQTLSQGWLFIHVPVTYSLIVLTLCHVTVVYAFSSGDW